MLFDELITENDVANLLRISSARLSRLVKRSEIPHVLLPGGEVRFITSDLEQWVESYRQTPNPAVTSTGDE